MILHVPIVPNLIFNANNNNKNAMVSNFTRYIRVYDFGVDGTLL